MLRDHRSQILFFRKSQPILEYLEPIIKDVLTPTALTSILASFTRSENAIDLGRHYNFDWGSEGIIPDRILYPHI